MTTTEQTTDGVAVTLENIDPSTLLMSDNVRSDAAASLSKGFIGSIRERGVLEAIIADRNTEGVTTVRAGHRRTLAAIEANLPTVPVMVHTGPQARVDRIIDQIVENEHREALSNRDKVAAVHQLALEGLSVATIAKRAALSKKEVAAAITIADSPVAEHADQLTLEQAAAMVEFEADPVAVEQLLNAAPRGQFDQMLSRLRQDRAVAEATAVMIVCVEAAGLTAITEAGRYDGPDAQVAVLRTKDGDRITDAEHAECPGHAMWVTTSYNRVGQFVDYGDDEEEDYDDEDCEGQKPDAAPDADPEVEEEDPWRMSAGRSDVMAIPVCTDWKANGHRHSWHSTSSDAPRAADMSEDEREAARLARRKVIENNKAWDACTPVRRAWLAQFAQRKAAPAGAEALIAEAAISHYRFDVKDWGEQSWTAIGIDRTQLVTKDATPKRCTQITLMHVLVAWESHTFRQSWRDPGEWTVRILTAMTGWGYTLSDVEQEVTSTKK